VVSPAPFTTTIMPMLDATGGNNASDRRLTHTHEGGGDEDVSEIVASLSNASDMTFGPPDPLGCPTSKKQ